MEAAGEDSPDRENVDGEEEKTPEEIRKKKLALKLQRLKLRKSLNQQRSYTQSGFNMSAVYEMRLRKLRKNNKTLAKALADQKMENQQWYNEVISLKGELQEAHERLLRSKDKNCEMLIEREVERRIKEIGEPLNSAISQAMENLLVVVENFSKVKQLANARNATSRSSSSSSSFSFPRTSGSRAPLGSCGNTSSPCQSVRPMVSGHVLQPAMVAIQKLDDVWKARVKERIQARGEMLDMSTIGEHSGVSLEDTSDNISQDDDSITSSQQSAAEQAHNVSEESMPESLSPRSPGRPGISPRSPARGGRGRRGRSGENSRSSVKLSPAARNTSPAAAVSPLVSKGGGEINQASRTSLEHGEDPLEGPSWWYADSASSGRGRSRGRARGRGRGRKRGRPKSSHGLSPVSHVNISLEAASSESDEEEIQRKRNKNYSNDGNKSKSIDDAESPKEVLEHSYLASPRTMLTKLENLEAKAGRRSKSKSKGRSLRISEATRDSLQNQQQTSSTLQKDRTSVSKNRESCTTTLSDPLTDAAVDAETKESEGTSVLTPTKFRDDYLISDSDLTCIGDMSMDMTEPISKILSQAAAESKKKEAMEEMCKNSSDKKFFKNQTARQSQNSGAADKTPFDLSLMDATYVTIPPYSSQKSVEKENMPPVSSDNGIEKEDEPEKDEVVSLRQVSIILKDVMKSSESLNLNPEVTVASPAYESELNSGEKSKTPEKPSRKSGNGRKRNSRNRKTYNFSIMKTVDDEEEEEEDEDSWSPGANKRKKGTQSQRGRRTSGAKKRASVIDKPVMASKKSNRKNKSESEIPFAAPSFTGKDASFEGFEENVNKKTEHHVRNSIAVSPVLDSVENIDMTLGLSECYVKICRTPLKEVRKSIGIAPIDDSCLLLDELPDFGLLYKKLQATDDDTTTKKTKESEAGSEDLSTVTPTEFGNDYLIKDTDPDDVVQVVESVAGDAEAMDTTSEAGEVPPDEVQEAASDQVVPNRDEANLKKDTANDKASNGSATVKVMNAVDPDTTSTIPKRSGIRKGEESPDVMAQAESPRKRRGAAMKILSFKEPLLNKKMRQSGENVPSTRTKSERKSGRKISSS